MTPVHSTPHCKYPMLNESKNAHTFIMRTYVCGHFRKHRENGNSDIMGRYGCHDNDSQVLLSLKAMQAQDFKN